MPRLKLQDQGMSQSRKERSVLQTHNSAAVGWGSAAAFADQAVYVDEMLVVGFPHEAVQGIK